MAYRAQHRGRREGERAALCALRAATCDTWWAAARIVFQWIPSSAAMIMLAFSARIAGLHLLQQRQRPRVRMIIEYRRPDIDEHVVFLAQFGQVQQQGERLRLTEPGGVLHEGLGRDAYGLHRESGLLEACLRCPQTPRQHR